jgi:alcohol dehydrogenase
MKALIYNGPGDLKVREIPKPRIEERGDVIIKVVLSAICKTDLRIAAGELPEVMPGTVPGHEFVGIVVDKGAEVKSFKEGDRVAVSAITNCGRCDSCTGEKQCRKGGWLLGYSIDGGHAEFVRVPGAERNLAIIPDTVSFRAALFAGDLMSGGLLGAEKGAIQRGKTVVVAGCGAVGICSMIAARSYKPSSIIAIDQSIEQLEKVKSWGIADIGIHIDSGVEQTMKLTGGRGADTVIEATGKSSGFNFALKSSAKGGSISVVSRYPSPLIFSSDLIEERKISMRTEGYGRAVMERVLKLIEEKSICTEYLCSMESTFEEILTGYKNSKNDSCLRWVLKHGE